MKTGKIIVLTGPRSSGKTSLMNALLKSKIMNFVTIPRKQIGMESVVSFGEKEYFYDLMDKVTKILGKPISLFELINTDNPISAELKSSIRQIIDKNYEDFLHIKFTNYICQIKSFTDYGYNVILDDTELYFHFDRFCSYGNRLEIKMLLLYENLEGLSQKCNIRNKKFLNLLQQAEDIKRFQADFIVAELQSNDSGSTFRYPIWVVDDYISFYNLKKDILSKERILDKITQSKLNRLIDNIYEDQEALDKTLEYHKYPNTYKYKDKIYYESLVKESLKGNDTYFVVPKFKIDFIQSAQQILNIELLENQEFLLFFFKDIKNWIEDNTNITIIFQEWALWSKCYGKVVVINGVSSSGKTTLSKELMKFGLNHISIDNLIADLLYNEATKIIPSILDIKLLTKQDIVDIIYRYPQYDKYNEEQSKQISTITQQLALIDYSLIKAPQISLQKVIKQMFEKTKQFIFRGENVVIDTVMFSTKHIKEFDAIFDYPHKMILLYTSLQQNLMNCFLRPLDDYRYPDDIISQFVKMYQFGSNGNQGMIIDKEKILEAFEYCRSNIKERCYFFTELDFFNVQEKTAKGIQMLQMLLKNANTVFISSHIEYDMAITIPERITDQLLSFLINFLQQSDNSLELTDPIPNFIAFYQNEHIVIREEQEVKEVLGGVFETAY